MSTDIAILFIFALATWRLSSLLACEDGPFGILARLRVRLGVRFDNESKPYGTNEMSKLILCPWCSSLWFGAFWTLVWLAWPQGAHLLALPLALSAMAVLVEKYAR